MNKGITTAYIATRDLSDERLLEIKEKFEAIERTKNKFDSSKKFNMTLKNDNQGAISIIYDAEMPKFIKEQIDEI